MFRQSRCGMRFHEIMERKTWNDPFSESGLFDGYLFGGGLCNQTLRKDVYGRHRQVTAFKTRYKSFSWRNKSFLACLLFSFASDSTWSWGTLPLTPDLRAVIACLFLLITRERYFTRNINWYNPYTRLKFFYRNLLFTYFYFRIYETLRKHAL